MKKIIIVMFLLLVIGTGYSQEDAYFQSDTLIAGTDSLVIDTLYNRYENVYVNVIDTQATAKDSVAFETWDYKTQTWIRIAAYDCYFNIFVQSGAAITGAPKRYLLNDKSIYILRQRLLQGSYRAGARVITSVNGKN